ncbi:MAG: PadR family transcriptional regulator [Candidatus Aminicenantes bacterium]|nr:PadR family transcriptional regulator [Candidatus Aminicenantes bacterium]
MNELSRREEQLLLIIGYLGKDAYLVAIRKQLSFIMRKECSIGAVHIPLTRLEKSGQIMSSLGESTAVRGGRRKKIYRLTPLGEAALQENKRMHDFLWADFRGVRSSSGGI